MSAVLPDPQPYHFTAFDAGLESSPAPSASGADAGDEPSPAPDAADEVRAKLQPRLDALAAEVAALEAERDALRAELDGARSEAEAAQTVREASDRVSLLWTETLAALEPRLAALAVDVAERVLAAPLTAEARAAADRAIADAVDRLAADCPVTVRLHPVDLLHLQESGLADTLSATHPRLRWEPDAALAQGDWTAASEDAEIHRIAAATFADLKDHLGLTT